MSPAPRTVDEYLAPLSADKRAALEKLRRAIKTAAPTLEECISYGIPSFRLDGKFLMSFGAAAKHCAFYPGTLPIRVHKDALKAYDTKKGTIRFDPARPMPATLVKKLVRSRVAERSAPRASKVKKTRS